MATQSQRISIGPTTGLPLVGQTLLVNVLWSILVITATPIRAADYVEILAELNSTWRSQTTTNHHTKTATCIVGSNGWFISGDFLRNGKVDYWLVRTNLVERRIITSSMYLEQAKDFISEKILGRNPPSLLACSYPRAGETFTIVHPSPLGQPAGHGIEGVVWLAFCSGNYLKQAGRQIPMPIGPSSEAFGYSDKTVVFDDALGLPRSVELYATNGSLVCEYEALETTNFLGRTFPLQFRVIQRGEPARGSARFASKSELLGRVTSIKHGKQPKLPDEVWEKLEK